MVTVKKKTIKTTNIPAAKACECQRLIYSLELKYLYFPNIGFALGGWSKVFFTSKKPVLWSAS
jgi:hypothetical protein